MTRGYRAKWAIGRRRCAVGAARAGFTLVEMLTTVAALVIVLGLMVSLARYVREQSATELTRDVLRKLDAVMGQYLAASDGRLPDVTPLLAADVTAAPSDEAELAKSALANNRQFVRALVTTDNLARELASLSAATCDMVTVRDAWGMPIVLMPRGHPLIGMAPRDQYFFVSAGADRRYLSRADNLYSYEIVATPQIP
jgi:prepilin-type N-terminal cleavage/methylation domain-containing protein